MKTGSQRQIEFVERKRQAGYVQLTGVFVPAAAKKEVREAIRVFVAKWEEQNTNVF